MSPHTVNCPLQGRVADTEPHSHCHGSKFVLFLVFENRSYWAVKAGLQLAILLPHPPGITGAPSHPVRKLVLETSQECYYSSPTKEKKRRNRKPRLSSLLSLTPFPSSRIFLLPQNRFLGTSHHYLIFLSSLRQTKVAKQSLGTWGRLIMSCFQTVKRVGQTVSCALC